MIYNLGRHFVLHIQNKCPLQIASAFVKSFVHKDRIHGYGHESPQLFSQFYKKLVSNGQKTAKICNAAVPLRFKSASKHVSTLESAVESVHFSGDLLCHWIGKASLLF